MLNRSAQFNILILNNDLFKIKMLNWAERFNIFSFLDNHNYDIQPGRYECLQQEFAPLSIQIIMVLQYQLFIKARKMNPFSLP